MRSLSLYLVGFATVFTSIPAWSAPVERIYGGIASPTCAWPNVVMIETSDGICSGTLVAPQVVVYAAHCGSDVQSIYFGEDVATYKSGGGSFTIDKPSRTITPAGCKVYPGHDPVNGTDWAYCTLTTPITDVPIVPIMMGCEAQAVVQNKPVTLVGFGEDEQGLVGQKRQVTTIVDGLISNKVLLGANGDDSCFGDSGGPAFIQMLPSDPLAGTGDGSWRQVGITSYGTSDTCGTGTFYTLLSDGVPWIEQSSGFDITPCTDANGTWEPTIACGGFAANPNATGGNWTTGCSTSVVTGQSTTCGAPFLAGPPVSITAPTPGAAITIGTNFTVQASAPGAARVQALFDNEAVSQTASNGNTYSFGPVKAAYGSHTLAVTAWDANNNSTTDSVTLNLGTKPSGCVAGAPSLIPALLAAAGLLRKRRRTALVLALLLGVAACGSKESTHQIAEYSGNRISTQASGPVTATSNIPPSADPVPVAGATVTGSVAGFAVPTFVNYFYGGDANQTELVVVITNESDFCTLLANNSDSAMDHALELTLLSVAPNTDEPLDGNFTVVDPNTVITQTGNYATAAFMVNNAQCRNTLPQESATTGSISLHTVIGNAGSYITGSLSQVTFGADVISGTFVGQDCVLPESVPQNFTCRASP